MKISLQLTASAWSQFKLDVLRLNYRLAGQGLAIENITKFLEYLDQDHQLAYPFQKLAMMLHVLLSKSVMQIGCTLGPAICNDLLAKLSWVIIDKAEYKALQGFNEPLPITTWQNELVTQFGVGQKISLGELTQQILWQNAKGQWFINTLAWAALLQQTATSANAQFNQVLIAIRLAQASHADWHRDAIKVLEVYTQADEQALAAKQQQALSAYHLCEIYRLRLKQARLPAQRYAYEVFWHQSYQQLKQAGIWQPLQTQAEIRLAGKYENLLFYFYKTADDEVQPIAKAADNQIEQSKQPVVPHQGSWLAVGCSGVSLAMFSALLYLVVKTVLAMTFTITLLTPIALASLLTLGALIMLIVTLSCCINDIICDWRTKKQSDKTLLELKTNIDELMPIEVQLPADIKAKSASLPSASMAENARNNTTGHSHPPTQGLGQFLSRIGFYRNQPALKQQASGVATKHSAV